MLDAYPAAESLGERQENRRLLTADRQDRLATLLFRENVGLIIAVPFAKVCRQQRVSQAC